MCARTKRCPRHTYIQTIESSTATGRTDVDVSLLLRGPAARPISHDTRIRAEAPQKDVLQLHYVRMIYSC